MSLFVRIALLCWLTLLVQPLAAEVDVSIDRNPVQVNESFQLVFTATGSPSQDPDFSVLQQDFLILGSNRSNNISIINGEYRRSVKWTLQLMAKQIGEHVIPPIRFDDEQSQAMSVTVNPSALASLPHDEQILELSVDESRVSVQSQVILTMRLLSASDISAYQFGDIDSSGLDLVIEPLGDVRQYQTRIADRSYLVLEKEFALFPQQTGRIEIPPVSAEVRLLSRSALDPFNSGGAIRRFSSQPLVINVDPIPSTYAGRHWLPANRIELREKWSADVDNLTAGEPVTRSLALVADGLTAAQLPEFELAVIDGVNQYPDKPSLKDSLGRSGVIGQRFQEIALIPGAAGVYQVPEMRLDWWNRNTGRMETLRLPARELRVTGGTAVTPEPPIPESTPEPVPIQPQHSEPVSVSHFWPWFSLLLLVVLLLSNLFWWQATRRPVTSAVSEKSPDFASARRQLQQACLANDSGRARAALLVWGAALLAPRPVSNLAQLCRLLGADMTTAVDELNRSRYASEGGDWQGAPLWLLCQQLEQDHHQAGQRDRPALEPLNP